MQVNQPQFTYPTVNIVEKCLQLKTITRWLTQVKTVCSALPGIPSHLTLTNSNKYSLQSLKFPRKTEALYCGQPCILENAFIHFLTW